jgi:succinate dehydrogenase / fumarate reductase cytochrome b subunit
VNLPDIHKEGKSMAEAKPRTVSPEARRPLSPHLQIYRPMLTMMMSIMHRITGAALYFGTLLLAWWLIAAATDARAFDTANGVLTSFLGRIVLLGFTWALFHHLLGGIRHFIWDTGRGMDHPEREYLAQATLVGGLVLTLVVWIVAYAVR